MTPSLWSLVLYSSFLCFCRADVLLYPTHSWAFPGAASSSMIIQDTPCTDEEGSLLPPLRARATTVNIRASDASGDGSISENRPDHDRQIALGLPLNARDNEVPAPDVGDRETLLNLARASWDAYHSTPKPDHWYDIHGMNWVRSDPLGQHNPSACSSFCHCIVVRHRVSAGGRTRTA